jgi:multicomponent Na+:H+ antiporter subunit D
MIKRLAKCIREYKRDTILSPVIVSLEVVIDVIIPFLLAFLIDNGVEKGDINYIVKLGAVLVGLALLSEVSFTGALIHVAAHMLIKVCLFLFAGEMIYKFHKHKVDEFDGIGKIMPISTWAYTFASLGLVGIPMTAGFISKWYLATSAVESSVSVFNWLVPIILLVSAILTAGYLFPITIKGFFTSGKSYEKNEAKPLMYVPMMILSILVLVIGIYSTPLLDLISKVIGK